jgi:hypothetical protein
LYTHSDLQSGGMKYFTKNYYFLNIGWCLYKQDAAIIGSKMCRPHK